MVKILQMKLRLETDLKPLEVSDGQHLSMITSPKLYSGQAATCHSGEPVKWGRRHWVRVTTIERQPQTLSFGERDEGFKLQP